MNEAKIVILSNSIFSDSIHPRGVERRKDPKGNPGNAQTLIPLNVTDSV